MGCAWLGQRDQLHRARNEAQHASVVPDREQLPSWTDAAWAFIDSLCIAAFERSLDDIVLADAVRDPSLHDLLQRSEEALTDDPLVAFTLATAAFRQAREWWRVQRMPEQFPPAVAGTLLTADPTAGVRTGLQALDDFLEVQMFANDAGDYIWLRRAREEQETAGWTPPPEEARRALLFAASWIVRWEIFDLGYPLDRWEAHRESIQPPIIGASGKPLVWFKEASLTDEAPGQPARCVMQIQLANVPDRGRGPWGPILERALADATAEAGLSNAFARAFWSYSGILLLWVNLGHDPKIVASIVRRAVELAHERHTQQHSDTEQRERQRLQDESAFRETVIAARSDLGLFHAVTIETDKQSGTYDSLVRLELRIGDAGQAELHSVVDIFRGAGGVLAKTDRLENGVAFNVFELTEANQGALAQAIRSCEDQVRHLRDHSAKQRLAFQTFVAGIQQEMGEPPSSIPVA